MQNITIGYPNQTLKWNKDLRTICTIHLNIFVKLVSLMGLAVASNVTGQRGKRKR